MKKEQQLHSKLHPKRPKKKYGIYHWDTFDDDTRLIYEEDDFDIAVVWVKEHYGKRLRSDGADKCEIVEYPEGNIVKRYSVG